MEDPELASYIGMGVQALSSGIGGLFTNNAIKKENQKNRDWNEKMWHLTNEWNSPENQRRLYEQAGLNPALLYGNNTSALSSYTGNLGTSENFKNPAENVQVQQGILQAEQLKLNSQIVESQKEVNDSIITENIAKAEEIRSRIPANLSENRYIQELTQVQKNENAWYDLSLPIKHNLLDLQQAIMAGQAAQVVELTKKLIQDRENSKVLTDLQVFATNNAVELSWKQYDLSKQELGAKVAYWLKLGDAAERNSKANFLNALTNGQLASLKEKEFNKFSDAELDILQGKAMQLRKANAWVDILNEQAVEKGNVQINLIQSQSQFQDLQNLNYYNNMMLDFTKSIFGVSYNSRF